MRLRVIHVAEIVADDGVYEFLRALRIISVEPKISEKFLAERFVRRGAQNIQRVVQTDSAVVVANNPVEGNIYGAFLFVAVEGVAVLVAKRIHLGIDHVANQRLHVGFRIAEHFGIKPRGFFGEIQREISFENISNLLIGLRAAEVVNHVENFRHELFILRRHKPAETAVVYFFLVVKFFVDVSQKFNVANHTGGNFADVNRLLPFPDAQDMFNRAQKIFFFAVNQINRVRNFMNQPLIHENISRDIRRVEHDFNRTNFAVVIANHRPRKLHETIFQFSGLHRRIVF